MSQSFRLYRLQQLDSQLDRIRSRLEEIKLELADDSNVREAQTNANQAEAELQIRRKGVRRAEEAVVNQRIKIEQTEASLYGGKIQNPKELQDLQNEAASLKRYLSVLEDRELEAMLEEEASSAVYKDLNDALQTTHVEQDRKKNQLLEEQDRISKEFPRLEEERMAAVASIPVDEITLYDQIRRQRRGIAIALVKDKACSACGTVLSATLLDAARISPKLQRCETCGRILYVGQVDVKII